MTVTVEKIFVYPLKCARGMSVQRASATKRGLAFDRTWIIAKRRISGDEVSSEDSHVPQWTYVNKVMYPRLCLLEATILDYDNVAYGDGVDVETTRDVELVLKCEGSNELHVDSRVSNPNKVYCNVIGETLQMIDEGDEAAEWVTKALKTKEGDNSELRLLRQYSERGVEREHLPERVSLRYGETSSANTMPFMLLSKQSFLQVRYEIVSKEWLGPDEAQLQRFRPNIYVNCTSGKGFEEDTWGRVRIGNLTMRMTGLCQRCPQTTVDPLTAQKDADNEPLRSLRQKRMSQIPGDTTGPFVGIKMVEERSPESLETLASTIHVGDVVDVMATVDPTEWNGNGWRTGARNVQECRAPLHHHHHRDLDCTRSRFGNVMSFAVLGAVLFAVNTFEK